LTLLEIGRLREATSELQHALVLNRELKDTFQEGVTMQGLGRALITMGDRLSLVPLRRSLQQWTTARHAQAEGYASAYLAERSLWLCDFHTARACADRAWELAGVERHERDFIRAALFQGRAALGLGDLARADERLHHALTRTRAVYVMEFELPALIAIADVARERGDLASAKASLNEVWDAAERGPYPLHQADAYNLRADILWAEGDKRGAIEAATKAYRAAWCDGPPYVYNWGLERAKVHLQAFGAPEPEMQPFDESRFKPMPEIEINPKDEYWVDPDALD
jgi:ATP/maltotriose-dependent transcriptional regulator MalT